MQSRTMSCADINNARLHQKVIIEPYDLNCLRNGGLRLTLDDQVKVDENAIYVDDPYCAYTMRRADPNDKRDVVALLRADSGQESKRWRPSYGTLDLSRDLKELTRTIDESGWCLNPGIVYQMRAIERVDTRIETGIVELAHLCRLGITVKPGPVDWGNDRRINLFISVIRPVLVHRGLEIATLVFYKTFKEL